MSAQHSDGAGLAGGILAIVRITSYAWFPICGPIVCPIALLISLVGLNNPPKGFKPLSFVGTLLGLLGCAPCIVGVLIGGALSKYL
jgi:hypothetical protein